MSGVRLAEQAGPCRPISHDGADARLFGYSAATLCVARLLLGLLQHDIRRRGALHGRAPWRRRREGWCVATLAIVLPLRISMSWQRTQQTTTTTTTMSPARVNRPYCRYRRFVDRALWLRCPVDLTASPAARTPSQPISPRHVQGEVPHQCAPRAEDVAGAFSRTLDPPVRARCLSIPPIACFDLTSPGILGIAAQSHL
jgi:hypothetical protein